MFEVAREDLNEQKESLSTHLLKKSTLKQVELCEELENKDIN